MDPQNVTINSSLANETSTVIAATIPHVADSVLIAVGTTIAAFGFIGNTFTVAKIISDRFLHKVVYTAVACLAVADILCIVLLCVRLCLGKNFNDVSDDAKIITLSVSSCVVCSSAIHTIILSAIRYGMIVHPITTRYELSSAKVIMTSLIGWIISILIGCCYAYYNVLFYAKKISEEFDALVQVSFVISILLIPIIFFVVFYILEYRALKHSMLMTINQNKRRLTSMIKLVLLMYVVCLTPYVVTDVFRLVQLRHKLLSQETYKLHTSYLLPVAKVFYILVPSINPFIYFVYAKPWENNPCVSYNSIDRSQSTM